MDNQSEVTPVQKETVQSETTEIEQKPRNIVGLIGFILSLIYIPAGFIPFISWIVWIPAVVLSLIGLSKKPKGLAIAGTVISLGSFVLEFLFGFLIGLVNAVS